MFFDLPFEEFVTIDRGHRKLPNAVDEILKPRSPCLEGIGNFVALDIVVYQGIRDSTDVLLNLLVPD